jgi:hypothetical protein
VTHARAILATLSLAAAGCTFQAGTQAPSPWALNYPDTSPVTSGRVVRFSANYGLTGPSPAFVYRDVNGSVSGQMLVWYRRYEPDQARGRTAADSAARWAAMQSEMDADRARMDSTYGCTSWAKGDQDGPAWVCRVPPRQGTPDWAGQLRQLDSLAAHQPPEQVGGGRRGNPVAPPPNPSTPGNAPFRPREGSCMDGGSWRIDIRDAHSTHVVMTPARGGGCPLPPGPVKNFDDAGWRMLKQFIGEVM